MAASLTSLCGHCGSQRTRREPANVETLQVPCVVINYLQNVPISRRLKRCLRGTRFTTVLLFLIGPV